MAPATEIPPPVGVDRLPAYLRPRADAIVEHLRAGLRDALDVARQVREQLGLDELHEDVIDDACPEPVDPSLETRADEVDRA